MDHLLSELEKLGVTLRIEGEELRASAPAGALTESLRESLRTHKAQILERLRSRKVNHTEDLPKITPDPVNRGQPFPLTDLQHAYWLGRDSALVMGNVATHLYLELDCVGMDLPRLERAFQRLIARHDMLRAIVLPSGLQCILSNVPEYRFTSVDCTRASQADGERQIARTRDILSHQVLKPDQWPLFDVRATVLEQSVRVHVSLDLLIFDAFSIFLLFQEWNYAYSHPELELAPLDLSFRDYVLAERSLKDTEAYRRAQAYWMERVERLPAAPELPMRGNAATLRSPRFSRHEQRIEKATWERLKLSARQKGLTPSGALMAVYAQVLALWSTSPHFTLNVTVSNRLPMHAQVHRILGDFTSLTLVEVDGRDQQATFVDFARRVQEQFLNDLQFNQMTGVKVMQEWNKRNGVGLAPSMPVVFSSGLIWTGEEEVGHLELFGKKVFSVSQTSQVWLDHHVMELQGDLNLVWDAAEGVFEPEVIDRMFNAYCDAIRRLCEDEGSWLAKRIVHLPAAMQERRVSANQTAAHLPEQRLHAGFVEYACKKPADIAVISNARTLSYGDVLAESAHLANALLDGGVRSAEPVAILMRKGWEQIVGVFGVLLAGASYMPIDADLPAKRQRELLEIGRVRFVLAQPGGVRAGVADGPFTVLNVRQERARFTDVHARSLARSPRELAYVIFTSGTTGVPKGVMIEHGAAMNTIEHVNRLFEVGAQDRVLAVSSLSFDLSVYDIFGVLGVGGSLVLPDAARDHEAAHWRELVETHRVTVWNSAPQLMRMLMDSVPAGSEPSPYLRTVLLSGDFIPLDLPERLCAHFPAAKVTALGGATEAAIWSNYYRVDKVAPSWTSIPYGKPLPNQKMWVYDAAFAPRPDYVRGRIFIGGMGLATGYWDDPEKTRARFVTHPETGERLYDTGDLGRYSPDGDIIILGRDDGQVKIRGHRVELGEIEVVLRQHPSLRDTVVVATSGPLAERRLIGYVEPDPAEPAVDAPTLKEFLRERLPAYMVPPHLIFLERIPLSPNGKVDVRALPSADGLIEEAREVVAPENDVERTLLDAWSQLIPLSEIGVTDNFFDLGGDSVLATQLVHELNAQFPSFRLEMHELFENLTIRGLAQLLAGRGSESSSSASQLVASDVRELLAASAEPVSGSQSSVRSNAVLVTGATGWVGAHVLAQLLQLTSARIVCVVSGASVSESEARLLDTMQGRGIEVQPGWRERVEAVVGDLSMPDWGLDVATLERLTDVDSIYHFAASLSVAQDYTALRRSNVLPLHTLLRLIRSGRSKRVFTLSPFAACRRFVNGQLSVSRGESVQEDATGFLTAYAQSKWVVERVLTGVQAFARVKIYRTSHALPASRGAALKPRDTYLSVLGTAARVNAIPSWADSVVGGVPVDVLARLLVEDSLREADYRGVIHLENASPLSMEQVVALLLESRGDATSNRVSLESWRELCLQAAESMEPEGRMLATGLFTAGARGSAIEAMFSKSEFEAGYFARLSRSADLQDLTPPDYWRLVARELGS